MDPTKAVLDHMDMNSNSKPTVKKGNITAPGDSIVVGTMHSNLCYGYAMTQYLLC